MILPDADFWIAAAPFLVYQFAFDKLCLKKLIFNVVASNKKVLKFHHLLGVRETHVENNGQMINGLPVGFVWFELMKQEGPAMYAKWSNILS